MQPPRLLENVPFGVFSMPAPARIPTRPPIQGTCRWVAGWGVCAGAGSLKRAFSASYQRHECLTRAERPNGRRRKSGEAKETGGFRPASEGS
jgi:hypothetical protein